MSKYQEEIRPHLVKALEIAQDREANPKLLLGPMSDAVKQEEATHQRVRAEILLWLADREWARERAFASALEFNKLADKL